MAAPHGVEIVRLEEEYVTQHAGAGKNVSGFRIVFVAVHAAEEDRLIVQYETRVLDGDAAEANAEGRVLLLLVFERWNFGGDFRTGGK